MYKTSLNIGNNLLPRHIMFKYKKLGFTGEPVTRRTHQSRASVNHVGT